MSTKIRKYMFNVQNANKNIMNILNQQTISPALEKHVNNMCEKSIKFIQEFLNEYANAFSPEEVEILTFIISQYKIIQENTQINERRTAITNIKNAFVNYSANSEIMLLRHPEKDNPDNIGKEVAGQRSWSKEGVRQAYQFGNFLLAECLLIDRPITINMKTSPYRRTQMLGEGIIKIVQQANKFYDKDIKINFEKKESLIDGALIDGDLIISMGGIVNWLASPNSIKIANTIQEWFNKNKYNKSNTYNITVGVTHLPILVSYEYHVMNCEITDPENDFSFIDFVKRKGDRYFHVRRLE